MIQSAVRQPVSVAVGVLLILLGGMVAFQRIAIQLTPNVEDTIVSISTFWEGASPHEMEQEVVDRQEDKLQGISGLKGMTSKSQQGVGIIRLEFAVGTPKEVALREVSEKLREVPEYPDGVDEPVIEASDPDTKDYIAWVVLRSTDPDLDIRDLLDFTVDRVVPIFERIPGMAEVAALGGREREVQVQFDPAELALRGIGVDQVVSAIQRTNQNRSAGAMEEAKSDVRVRLVSKYNDVRRVEDTVVAESEAGPIWVKDVATVVETFKEPRTFVRSRGEPVIAINFQREIGSNVMEVMQRMQKEIERVNLPGEILDRRAKELGLVGTLALAQVFDQTVYIDDALALVRNNIWIGGALAILVLLLFLKSFRSAGIIALAIPISVIGAVVLMVSLGRSVNVISLAGMAFAVGMVVDNAIVVLENIYRHLELGKGPIEASIDGTREVFGAILAATLTTVCVFIPILLIEEEAGQLFRDIALAIVASVSLSLIVSITVIPTSASRLLRTRSSASSKPGRFSPTRMIGDLVYWLCGSTLARLALVILFATGAVMGTLALMPPADYLPVGNRNLFFGLMIPPPNYNLDQRSDLGARVEETMRPFWEAGALEVGSAGFEEKRAALPEVPTFDFATMSPGSPVVPPPLENYFLVALEDVLFHGAISADPEKVVDISPLFAEATRADAAPGVFAFGFQVPLFQLGGNSGSAVKINFVGDNLDEVSSSALAVFLEMMGIFGPGTTQPDPSNFNVPGPELQVIPDQLRLAEVGLSPAALGLVIQALGDGAIVGEFEVGGQTIDLKVLAARGPTLGELGDTPIATPMGGVLPLSALAKLNRVNAAAQINRVARQRSVTLQFTPQGMPLEAAVQSVADLLERQRASGSIPSSVETSFSGSASKLGAVRSAMLGDGTLVGTLSSSIVLALLVVYLLLCVLFQSFLRPAVILFSVPLATMGGFAALQAVHIWSLSDPYMPMQNMDVLTMLGFVILLGVVVNNAILIVHQSINFMRGDSEVSGGERRALPPREAIAEATRSRVRPILMGTLTSVGGMAPLVFMPGSGSELYRGLGSVVLGGLMVSTIFTLVLVPLLFSLLCDLQQKFGWLAETRTAEADAERGGVSGLTKSSSALALLIAVVSLFAASCRTELGQPGATANDAVSAESVTSTDAAARNGSEQSRPRVLSRQANVTPESLAGRLQALEASGGPDSWGQIELELDRDLMGEDQAILRLDLDRVLLDAQQFNLALNRIRIAPLLFEEDMLVADADFDSTFFAQVEYEKVDRPNPVPRVLVGGTFQPVGVGQSRSRRSSLSVGVRQRFESGASVEATSFAERFNNRTPGLQFDPDPAWRSGLALSVEQPLLRGFGRVATRGELDRLDRQREGALAGVQSDVQALAAATQSAYWDLYEAWQTYRIYKALVADGADVERVLFERQSFDTEPAQYSDALATLESRRANLIRAQLILRRLSDTLKLYVQSPMYPLGSEVLIEPADTPKLEGLSYSVTADLARALKNRPEMQSALLAIEDRQIQERLTKNLDQPDLSLYGEVSLLGEASEIGRANRTLDNFISYVVGLRFELPAGNRAAHAANRRARLLEREAMLRYEEVALSIVSEVKAALRELETSWQLMQATHSLRLAQTENLRALLVEEQERSTLSPEFLSLKFQRQSGLALAQIEEVRAQCDYQRALVAYDRAIGGEETPGQ
ncbi:MAG: HAE1 family hydrophobic/amphiphilic exporter-1 [Planctomycetota bacterium]|jgi:HAE1 family hydrophobic/amphiphilic exporter-1